MAAALHRLSARLVGSAARATGYIATDIRLAAAKQTALLTAQSLLKSTWAWMQVPCLGTALRSVGLFLELVPERLVHQVGELAGIEENAVPLRAAFINHVRLIRVGLLFHLGAAERAANVSEPVEFFSG